MPSEFRFLLICLSASLRTEDGLVTLSGIVNEATATRGEPLELTAVLGVILGPEMEGRHLDLMAWKLDSKGGRQTINGYVGTPMILPQGMGPYVGPVSLSLPVTESGIYGFELFDREGTFGPAEDLLSTYMFGVTVQ